MKIEGYRGMMLLLAGMFGASGLAFAQNYPTKPVRLHAAGAGGGNDTAARIIAPELAAALGQPVIVENKAPAVLVTGAAKAVPDGYTILVGGGSLWTSPLFKTQPYDPVRDFAPIVTLTRTPNVLVVHPSLPVKNVADLVRLAKAKPGSLNFSTGSTGSSTHISGELFKSLASVNMQRVPYNDSAEIADLLSGQLQLTFGSAAQWGALIHSGKLRALATTGSKRSAFFPDLPLVSETLPGYVSEQLLGLLAPAKTPDAIIRRLSQEASRALEKSEVRDRVLKAGLEPGGGTPEQLADAIKTEMARIEKIIRDGGGKPANQ